MKITAYILTLVVAMSALSGCNTKNQTVSEEKTELRWVLGGTEKADSQMVEQEFNKGLQEFLPGITVKFEPIATSDYAEKWQLMAASSENVDIAWLGWMMNLSEEVRKGACIPLDDLMKEHAQDMLNELPPWLFEKQKMNGKIYAIPNYQMMTERWAMYTQKAYADKYLDVDAIQTLFEENEFMTSECYNALENYLKTLKENGDLQLGLSTLAYLPTKGYESLASDLYIKKNTTDYKVYDLFEMPEMRLRWETMRRWYQQGYIRNDILTDTNPIAGKSRKTGNTLRVAQYFGAPQETEETAKEGILELAIPLEKNYYIGSGTSATNTMIPRTCKDSAAAMKVIDLINTKKGKKLYNMAVYGIEGTHYNKIDENRIETVGYNSTSIENAPYFMHKWIIGNTFNAYETQDEPVGWNNHVEQINTQAQLSRAIGFRSDLTSVANEMVQCKAASAEFFSALEFGTLENVDKAINDYKAKLEKAGYQTIKAELQKQITQWAKENGKIQ